MTRSNPTSRIERGLESYRNGRFFDAHEHWEELWRTEPDAQRRLMLQALIQLAAALHKLHSGVRPGGAPALLERAADKLSRVDGHTFGVDPARLRRHVLRLRQQLEATADGTGRPDRWSVPPL